MSAKQSRVLLVLFAFTLVALVFALQGCSSDDRTREIEVPATTTQDATEAPAATPEEEPLHVSEYKPNGDEVAVIKTNKGTIKFKFYAEDAPNHVASFIELAQAGFYDGVKFHRVEPGFVVQGGDPLSKNDDPMVGTGGPGYGLAAEFNSRQHLEGTVAMARSASPDSGGSQFYICLGPQPSLDGQYTVFGQVTEGMDVVKQITVGDVMESVTIENASE